MTNCHATIAVQNYHIISSHQKLNVKFQAESRCNTRQTKRCIRTAEKLYAHSGKIGSVDF
jgi:hypothetical protein